MIATHAVRRAALMAGAALLAACDGGKKAPAPAAGAERATVEAPSSTYQSLTGKFAFAVPGAWGPRVRIVEEPGVSAADSWPGVQHAVHFLFQPQGAGAKPMPLLSILVYDSATVAKPGAKAPAGDEVAQGPGRVLRALVPAANPYPAGADHDAFQSLLPTLAAVKGAIATK